MELFSDIIKIIDEIGQDEKELIGTVKTRRTWAEFYSMWENDVITLRLIDALRRTFDIYYKKETPAELIDSWENLKKKYENAFHILWAKINFSFKPSGT